MASSRLELSDLGNLVAAERDRRGLSLRDAAADVGMPFNTLARVEKGHVPDLPKFKRLVDWCGADITDFFELQQKTTATTDAIADHLQMDPNLPTGAAEQIAGIVRELYQALAKPQQLSAAHLRAARTFRPEAARALGEILGELHQALLEEDAHGPQARV